MSIVEALESLNGETIKKVIHTGFDSDEDCIKGEITFVLSSNRVITIKPELLTVSDSWSQLSYKSGIKVEEC